MYRYLILLLLGLGAAGALAGTGEAQSAEGYHERGRELYARGEYAAAVEAFEEAVKRAPRSSELHRSLGKAYGRLAEQSSWLEAIGLAKRTRVSLETAVALDGSNLPALVDLMSFYENAPGFLGGGGPKAAAVRSRIEALCQAAQLASDDCEP